MPIIDGIEYIDSPEHSGSMDTVLNPASFFDTSHLKRRELINDAKLLASNSDPSKGPTWSDYVNERVLQKDKFSRRENLYRRKFNNQLKKNIKATEQRQLLEAAKAGDSKAFERYTGNEISDKGKYFSWIPGLAGAGAIATSGAIGAGINGIKSVFANPYARSLFDMTGTIDSVRNALSDNGISKTIRLAKEGDIYGTAKSALGDVFDIVGTTDAFFNPQLRQAFKWSAEDTANAFRSIINKDIPVLGIANLPNTSRVVNTSQPPTWGGTQWDNLDSGTRAELIRSGLGRWDIQALLDRGYTPEQLRWFNDDFSTTVTRNVTGNRRANMLAERLANAGIAPEQMSRREFLENAMQNGYEIGLDEHYYPRLISEIGEGQSASQIPDGYLERFYPDLTIRSNTDVYNGGKYLQMRGHIIDALRILSPEEHAELTPKIRTILEEGAKSELSPEALEKQVELLFNINGKPFYRPKTQRVPKGRTVTEIIDPKTGLSKSRFVQDVDESGNPLFYKSTRGSAESLPYGGNWAANNWTLEQALNTPNPTNTAISLNEYTRETIPLRFTNDDLDWAYNHYMLFDVNPDELDKFKKLINESTPHGGTNLEFSKSLQSNVVANAALRDKRWVPMFFGLSDVPGRSSYRYDSTNGLEHALWNPRQNNPNKPWDLMDAVRKTTSSTEAYLDNMPVDVFKAFGAEIDPKTGMFITESRSGKQRLKGFPTYRFDLTYPSGAEKHIELPYTYIPSSTPDKLGRFKFVIPENWDGMKTLKRFNDSLRAAPPAVQQQFKVSLNYPLVGGRKLKLGGILHNINHTMKSALNIK